MTLGATLFSYWPTLLVLPAYLGFANAWRLRGRRVLCYGLSALSGLLLGASLYQFYFVLTQISNPHALLELSGPPLATHSSAQCALLLAGAVGMFVLSLQKRLLASLILGVAAWSCQTVATQYVVITQGFVCELNGILPLKSVDLGTCYPGQAAPRPALATQRFFLCTTLSCGRNDLLLVDGVGPLFKLRFDAQQLQSL